MRQKSIGSLIALFIFLAGLTGCEDDPIGNDAYDEATYALCQNTWEDTYVTNDDRDCVQQLTFYANGAGTDYRNYYSPYGQWLGDEQIPFYWDWDNRYFDSLFIDYPNGDRSYLDYIRITPRTLQCELDGYPVTFRAVFP